MSITAQVVYVHQDADAGAWDGTDPAGGDVRAVSVTQPTDATSSDSQCSFGTAAANIVVDPYTNRSTTGTADQDKFGWAVNVTGTDGMEGTATAPRFIKAGTWDFVTALRVGVAATSNYNVRASVYRISADGATRTLLFTSNASANAIPVVARTLFTFSSAAQPEFQFADNETVLVSYLVTKVDATVGAESVQFCTGRFMVGAAQANLCTVTVPSPGVRTEFQESVTVTAVGTASVTVGTKTVTGIVYDSNGAPVSGATVKLFRESDDVKISERASGADGSYTFTREDTDTTEWFCVGFSDDTHHGMTDRSIVAT